MSLARLSLTPEGGCRATSGAGGPFSSPRPILLGLELNSIALWKDGRRLGLCETL